MPDPSTRHRHRFRSSALWTGALTMTLGLLLLVWVHHILLPTHSSVAWRLGTDSDQDLVAPGQARHAGAGNPSSTPPAAWLPCVSYAPFRRQGHSPFDPQLRLDRQAIAEDLRLIARISPCLRLYGVGHGLDQVPGVARELGLQVVLGAWIDRDEAASEGELRKALELAHAHRDVVRMLVVGNEVLLRQERTAQDLAALVARARRESPVPVAYADVWEFWLRHAPVLSPAVDVAAIHILPYWEDYPIARAQAASHVALIHGQVRQRLAPLPIWVAETGWPSQGRARGPAVPGIQEQALFMRDLVRRASETGVDYNVIEAFDQPWKRHLEGAMGAGWGLMDEHGRIKDPAFPAGPLPVDPHGAVLLWATAAGAVMGAALFALVVRRRPARGAWPVLPGVPLVAGLWAHHAADLGQWARSPIEWTWAVGLTALTLAFTILQIQRTLRDERDRGHLAESAVTAALLFMLAATLLPLVFDGRYRALPVSLVTAAAVAALIGARWPLEARTLSPQTRGLAMINIAAATALPFLEGLDNLHALALSAAVLVLCGHRLLEHRGAHELRRAQGHPTV